MIGTPFRRRGGRRSRTIGMPTRVPPLALAAALGALALLLLGLRACLPPQPRPLLPLNRRLEALGASREPALAGRWLALIASQGGREQVVLVDVESGRPVPLPGLNRADAQPLSVGVDSRGERLVVARQRQGRTELVLYQRSLGLSRELPLQPAGVPRRLWLRADGRELAVEVSREGRWQVDLIPIP